MKLNNTVKSLGVNLSSIMAVIVGLWFFGKAPFNTKVDERINLFLTSAAMQIYIDDVIKKHEAEQIKTNSKKVKLRKLLANKMAVAEDEVHIEIGKLYKAEPEQIKENIITIQELKNRIKILENKIN